ncbi:MAG: hypothetical protein ABI693_27505 [Bryobacteraceae bacterium]
MKQSFGLLGLLFLVVPTYGETLVGKQVRFEATYPDLNSSYVSATVTVVDPGVEINCPTPSTTGPGCGININQGSYSIDVQADRIFFRTSSTISSTYGAGPCNCFRFTLVNPGQNYIASASLSATNVTGFTASRITVTETSIVLNIGGLPAPANGSLDLSVQLATHGPLTVTPQSLSFSGFSNGPTEDKFLDVGATSPGQPFTVSTSSSPWLTVYGSGPSPQLVQAHVDPTNLNPGQYTGSITINAAGATPPSVVVPVVYDVAAATPAKLTYNPPSVTIAVDPATHSGKGYLSLSNAGSGSLGPLTLTASSSPDFSLQLSTGPPDCSTRSADNKPQACVVNATITSNSIGTHPGKITVRNQQGVVLAEIPVLQQIQQATFYVRPRRYFVGSFADPTTGPPIVRQPQLKVLTVSNSSGLTDYSAYTNVPWLTVTPATGPIASTGTVQVNANGGALKPGGYFGSVVVRPLTQTGPPAPDNIAEVVMEVSAAPRNNIDLGDYGILIPGVREQYTFRVRGIDLVERSITITPNFRGGPAFFSVSPSSILAAVNSLPITLSLSSPAPPPGVYSGDVVIQAPGRAPQLFPVVAVVPNIGAAKLPNATEADSFRAAGCVPTRIIPVIPEPSKGFASLTGWPTNLEVRVVDDCGQANRTGVVVATFSNDDVPIFLDEVDTTGSWTGSWTSPIPNSNVAITITAISSDGILTGSALTGGSVEANPTPVPFLGEGGVLNGASFAIGGPLSPGSFVSIFGSSLAGSTLVAPAVPLPLTLAGASVQIGGLDAPVYYASDGLINAIVPYGLPVDRLLPISVKRGDAVSLLRSVPMAATAPGIFAYGDRQAIVVGIADNGAQNLADSSHPIIAGQPIVVYATGLGEVAPAVQAGSPTPVDHLTKTISPVTMKIGGRDANVFFSGLTPGSTGLYQVNAYVPAGITAGDRVAVVLTTAGQESVPTYISVK